MRNRPSPTACGSALGKATPLKCVKIVPRCPANCWSPDKRDRSEPSIGTRLMFSTVELPESSNLPDVTKVPAAEDGAVPVAARGGERHLRRSHHSDGARRSSELENLATTNCTFFHFQPSLKGQSI